MSKSLKVAAGMLGCLLLGIGIGYAGSGSCLYINGSLASRSVFSYNGRACVPIADVARALGLGIAQRADGYALAPAGGANQVGGVTGKVGDTLSNGQITLKVVSVTRTDHYTKRFDRGESTPVHPGDTLVIVTLRVKNATREASLVGILGGDNTSLTDQDEHSYQITRMNSDFATAGPTVLPGAAVDFALAFSIPKGEKMKDFIYQVAASSAHINFKKTNFRVSVSTP